MVCFRFSDTCPMILVANKIDLVHQRKIFSNQGEEMAQKLGVSGLCLCNLFICFMFHSIHFALKFIQVIVTWLTGWLCLDSLRRDKCQRSTGKCGQSFPWLGRPNQVSIARSYYRGMFVWKAVSQQVEKSEMLSREYFDLCNVL